MHPSFPARIALRGKGRLRKVCNGNLTVFPSLSFHATETYAKQSGRSSQKPEVQGRLQDTPQGLTLQACSTLAHAGTLRPLAPWTGFLPLKTAAIGVAFCGADCCLGESAVR